ncbi:MAG: FkbM family methyltransferase [Paracoccaceae bacterium]
MDMSPKTITLDACAPDFEFAISSNEYGFYCVPSKYARREAPKMLSKGEVYEAATVALIRRIIERGGDVVSGGAFIGDFFPGLSDALTDDAEIHSFEPNPYTRAATQYTIALNDLDRVNLHPCAVGAEPGNVSLQVENAHGVAMAGTSKIVDGDSPGATVSVDIARLDDLVAKERSVSLIHLDVEGYEVPALTGAGRILETNAPYLVLEAGKQWMRRQIESHLNKAHPELGYAFCGMVNRNAVYRALAKETVAAT